MSPALLLVRRSCGFHSTSQPITVRPVIQLLVSEWQVDDVRSLAALIAGEIKMRNDGQMVKP